MDDNPYRSPEAECSPLKSRTLFELGMASVVMLVGVLFFARGAAEVFLPKWDGGPAFATLGVVFFAIGGLMTRAR